MKSVSVAPPGRLRVEHVLSSYKEGDLVVFVVLASHEGHPFELSVASEAPKKEEHWRYRLRNSNDAWAVLADDAIEGIAHIQRFLRRQASPASADDQEGPTAKINASNRSLKQIAKSEIKKAKEGISSELDGPARLVKVLAEGEVVQCAALVNNDYEIVRRNQALPVIGTNAGREARWLVMVDRRLFWVRETNQTRTALSRMSQEFQRTFSNTRANPSLPPVNALQLTPKQEESLAICVDARLRRGHGTHNFSDCGTGKTPQTAAYLTGLVKSFWQPGIPANTKKRTFAVVIGHTTSSQWIETFVAVSNLKVMVLNGKTSDMEAEMIANFSGYDLSNGASWLPNAADIANGTAWPNFDVALIVDSVLESHRMLLAQMGFEEVKVDEIHGYGSSTLVFKSLEDAYTAGAIISGATGTPLTSAQRTAIKIKGSEEDYHRNVLQEFHKLVKMLVPIASFPQLKNTYPEVLDETAFVNACLAQADKGAGLYNVLKKHQMAVQVVAKDMPGMADIDVEEKLVLVPLGAGQYELMQVLIPGIAGAADVFESLIQSLTIALPSFYGESFDDVYNMLLSLLEKDPKACVERIFAASPKIEAVVLTTAEAVVKRDARVVLFGQARNLLALLHVAIRAFAKLMLPFGKKLRLASKVLDGNVVGDERTALVDEIKKEANVALVSSHVAVGLDLADYTDAFNVEPFGDHELDHQINQRLVRFRQKNKVRCLSFATLDTYEHLREACKHHVNANFEHHVLNVALPGWFDPERKSFPWERLKLNASLLECQSATREQLRVTADFLDVEGVAKLINTAPHPHAAPMPTTAPVAYTPVTSRTAREVEELEAASAQMAFSLEQRLKNAGDKLKYDVAKAAAQYAADEVVGFLESFCKRLDKYRILVLARFDAHKERLREALARAQSVLGELGLGDAHATRFERMHTQLARTERHVAIVSAAAASAQTVVATVEAKAQAEGKRILTRAQRRRDDEASSQSEMSARDEIEEPKGRRGRGKKEAEEPKTKEPKPAIDDEKEEMEKAPPPSPPKPKPKPSAARKRLASEALSNESANDDETDKTDKATRKRQKVDEKAPTPTPEPEPEPKPRAARGAVKGSTAGARLAPTSTTATKKRAREEGDLDDVEGGREGAPPKPEAPRRLTLNELLGEDSESLNDDDDDDEFDARAERRQKKKRPNEGKK